MNYILYQAYGIEAILQEAVFSILSIIKLQPDAKTWNFKFLIYTDRPEVFLNYLSEYQENIVFQDLNAKKVSEYRGAIQFVHRVKIKVIEEFLSKEPAKLLYVDSDTYFLDSPNILFEKIHSANVLMHIKEGNINQKINPIFKKMHKFLKKNAFELDNKKFQISSETAMWNAGVIGINEKNLHDIKDAISLTDQMYSRYQKHVMEQFAVSYVLARNNQILATDNIIYHYWDHKEFRQDILAFLKELQTLMSQNKGLNHCLQGLSTLPSARRAPAKLKFYQKIFKTLGLS